MKKQRKQKSKRDLLIEAQKIQTTVTTTTKTVVTTNWDAVARLASYTAEPVIKSRVVKEERHEEKVVEETRVRGAWNCSAVKAGLFPHRRTQQQQTGYTEEQIERLVEPMIKDYRFR